MSFPTPNHVEKRTDPTDGREYTFDEVSARLQGHPIDPLVFWYERMGVSQPAMPPANITYAQPPIEQATVINTEAVPTYSQYTHYGTTQPTKVHAFQPAPVKQLTFLSPRNVLFIIGFMIFFLLCIVPVWNSISLLWDSNYIFWAGRSVPTMIIIICFLMLCLYLATAVLFCMNAHPSVQGTDTSVMMVATVFITLFGLVLILVSLPLINQASTTYQSLMNSCEYGEQTHRLYEYSQVLHRIRSMPDCRTKYSVEECPGYDPAPPYTNFLKDLETNFRCSGFCYKPPLLSNATNATGSKTKDSKSTKAKGAKEAKGAKSKKAKGKKALLQTSEVSRHLEHSITPLSLMSEDSEVAATVHAEAAIRNAPVSKYPPTLFSDSNFQATCEGMAARDMKNFAGEIGQHTFFQGIYLVITAVIIGFLKLAGFCVRKG